MEAPGGGSEAGVLLFCSIVLLLLLLAGTFANFTVLLIFYRRPGLRTFSNRFVINLLGTNLAACCVFLPLAAVDNVLERPGAVLCSVGRAAAAGTCAASVLAVLLIAIDQYCAVVDPLRYHSRISRLRSAGMLVGSWCLAILFGILGGLVPMDGVPGSSLWRACLQQADDNASSAVTQTRVIFDSSLYRSTFAAVYAVIFFFIPFGAISWIYVCIYSAAHRNSKRARKTGSGPIAPSPAPYSPPQAAQTAPAADAETSTTITFSVAPSEEEETAAAVAATTLLQQPVTVTVTPPAPASTTPSPLPREASVRSTSSGIVNSLKYRISNASVFRYREETRAARVSALVIVMVAVCWFPYVAVLVVHSGLLAPLVSGVPHYVDAVSLAMLGAGTVVSPCLFALRSRRVQKEMRKLLGLKPAPGRGPEGGGPSVRKPRRLSSNYSHTALDVLAKECRAQRSYSECAGAGGGAEGSVIQSLLGRARWGGAPKCRTVLGDLIAVPDTALSVDTCRSSFSSGASTQCTSSSLDTGLDD